MPTGGSSEDKQGGQPESTGEKGTKATEPESAIIDRVAGDSLKLLGLGGTFVYGALFIGYRDYYSALGIRPEDVGVSHLFVLSRSIIFIFVVGIVAATVVFLVEVVAAHHGINWKEAMLMIFVTVLVFVYIGALLPNRCIWGVDALILISILGLGALFAVAVYQERRKLAWNTGLAFTVLVATVIPGAAVGWRTHELGETALRGQSVPPFKILNIPDMDVSTEEIRAEWICAERERPMLFDPPLENVAGGTPVQPRNKVVDGTLLGETSTNIFIRLQQSDSQGKGRRDQIIKLPQECVMLSRYRTFADADAS